MRILPISNNYYYQTNANKGVSAPSFGRAFSTDDKDMFNLLFPKITEHKRRNDIDILTETARILVKKYKKEDINSIKFYTIPKNMLCNYTNGEVKPNEVKDVTGVCVISCNKAVDLKDCSPENIREAIVVVYPNKI